MRYKTWISACNNPKLSTKNPFDVYKQMRICRRHFGQESKNGGCRRLLNTAVPTLFLLIDAIQPNEEDPLESYYLEDEFVDNYRVKRGKIHNQKLNGRRNEIQLRLSVIT